ncbi:MAG: EAL domain-containing protein [Spirochaetia bacterium]|nr:EAL domain-containing protein [Spirochaetia bacterium]
MANHEVSGKLEADKFKFIADTSKEFMTLISSDFRYEAANKAYLFAHGKTLSDVLGKSVDEIWGKKLFESVIKPALMESFEGKEIEYESWFPFPAMGVRCFEVRQYPYAEKSGKITHIAVVSRDITERKEVELKLTFQAFHDELTGLGNRKQLVKHLEQKLAGRKEPLAIHMVYLHKIKDINDTLGFAVGDSILKEAAKRLSSFAAEKDDLARVGGSVYVLLQDSKSGDEKAFAETLMRTLQEPYRLTQYDFRNTAVIHTSTSICRFPEHGSGAEELLNRSNIALRHSIEQGLDRACAYSNEIEANLEANLNLEKNLQAALAKSEFRVHYQPKVNGKEEITGMEALIRWQHPEKGMIPPSAFIPLAEKTGLIAPIGYWVLKEAVAFNQQLRKKTGKDLVVSVNLSPFQFADLHLLENIEGALAASGLPAHLLELEITESGAMENVDRALVTLAKLHELGVKISIDDFGTGFSSLSKLSMFPVDTLKVDKLFVDEVPGSVQAMITVTSIINLAKNLGFTVIVEGVETKEQFHYLISLGCNQIQGFYFSRPVPGEAFSELAMKKPA